MKKYIFITLLLVFSANDIFAYLDPGTGSYILQLLIAGIASALLAVKLFWNNIKDFFRKIFNKKKK